MHMGWGGEIKGVKMFSLKNVSRALLITSFSLGLVGCKTFHGSLNAHEDLKFKIKKKDVVVSAGMKDVKINFPSKKKIILEVSVAGNNNNPKIEFAIPKKNQLPAYSGRIELLAAESKQLYDIVGELDSDFEKTPMERERVACSIKVKGEECEVVVIDGTRDSVCKEITRTFHGERDREFHYSITHQRLDLQLLSPTDGRVVADLGGYHRDSQKITDWEGPCYVAGHHLSPVHGDFDLRLGGL